MTELSKRFQFGEIEEKWCAYWEDHDLFHARPSSDKKPYTIVIPPPNVTGILHMGHALNNTLQDIIIRYKRMNGFAACWVPGTDHAGIATQNVVEKALANEGKTRYDLGREELLKRLWDWKKQYGDTIINQLKRLGASCDWPRTRFTMDAHYSAAVLEVFVRLYKKGLIYRGQYIINWCPRCQTALSDEEAEHRETQGALYYIKYPVKDDPQNFLMVATTRPETMLGDVAVAVSPQDERFKAFPGKTLILPLMNREIPVITDSFVDPAFGTGAVKVTPAHDPNDFQMGERHQLEAINVMHPDARMNEHAGEFAGMDRFEARAAIVDTLKILKLLHKVENHSHAVGHCYRCHTVVEPYLSKQWFVKMKPLAEPALKAVQKGEVTFTPDRWTKVYTNWMENIRDWCISRQIWWGHRIPAWYCFGTDACPTETQEPIISLTQPETCPRCGSSQFRQDEDVLDTWFSSWLWPFATFGWPLEKSSQSSAVSSQKEDLEYFYPTHSLFTASEIIFFWVARMIMAGIEFMGDVPFTDVYIHGTVRDAKGLKMSKSLGNAIDPLEIIREYGADALRFSLIINSGQDLFISKEKFEIGRNFANKIWNASRLILMNQELTHRDIDLSRDIDPKNVDLPSRWIISRFYETLKFVSAAIENYRYSEAESLVYEFFWGHFCDWYLEIIKNQLSDPTYQKIAISILEKSVRMIHPFMPFVSEEIWEHLQIKEGPVCLQAWPKFKDDLINARVEKDMQTLIDIVVQIRNIKAHWSIKPMSTIDCHFATPSQDNWELLQSNSHHLRNLLKIQEFSLEDKFAEVKNAAFGLVDDIKFCLPLGDLIDIDNEKKRIHAQIEQLTKARGGLAKRLENRGFLEKAPADVVEKEQGRLKGLKAKIEELEKVIRDFK